MEKLEHQEKQVNHYTIVKRKAFVDNDGNVRIDNTATTKPKIEVLDLKVKVKVKVKALLKITTLLMINRKVIDKTSTVKPKLRKNGGVKDDRNGDHPER
jgi:hypothetical protein